MTAEERIRMIVLEAQALEETIKHYNPKCYIRTPYCKESIKRGVKQVRAHLMALLGDLDGWKE